MFLVHFIILSRSIELIFYYIEFLLRREVLWGKVSDIKADTACNRVIPCTILKITHNYLIFLLYDHFLVQFLIVSRSAALIFEVFWGKVFAIDADTDWNMGISCKNFKSLIKLYFDCFLIFGFPFYTKEFINGKIFIYVIEKIRWPLRQIWPEKGEYLKKIKSLIKLYFSCFLFYNFPFYIKKFINVRWQETEESVEQGVIHDLPLLSWVIDSIILKC